MKASEHPPRVRQRALPLKLSTAVSLMIGSVIGAVLLLVYALWYMQISNATRDGLKETALAVARTMADMPQVKRGLAAPPQQQIIQPLAQAITRRNDLLYAIVTDMHGIRYSHPDSSIIGKRFIGHDIQPTLQGKEHVAINHGVLAPALRVFP
ncbi:two-component system sensor histidine kinase DcuS, partial [Klebsiella quasipneumoniae]